MGEILLKRKATVTKTSNYYKVTLFLMQHSRVCPTSCFAGLATTHIVLYPFPDSIQQRKGQEMS